METIAKVLTTLNENYVTFARDTANQNERIIAELAKANEPLAAPVQYTQQTEIPTEPKWNVGDRVRVLNENSPWFGEIGKIVAKSSIQLEVEFDELVTLTGGKVVNKKASFSPQYLHNMDTHLKPVPLGPEWYVGAKIRVIDKFTIMYERIGTITAVTPTDVDVVFKGGLADTGAAFHPSQLEIIPLEGMSATVTIEGDFYFGQEGTVVKATPGWVEVMMHDSMHQNYGHDEIEIDWNTPRQHVCGKGCAGHTNDDPRVAIRNSPLADWNDNSFPRFKMGIGEALTMNRPIPDPAQYDDFIRWVFEEAGRQGIDPKKITFVQGDQEGQALMRLNTDYLDSDTPPGFQVKLPKGLEVPSPSYMEEHFGHLDPPIKRKHLGFAHMDGCVNEDCEGNCPAIVKSDFLRVGVKSGSISLQQALDIEEAEKKVYDDEGNEITPESRHAGFQEAIADTENRIPPYPGTVLFGETVGRVMLGEDIEESDAVQTGVPVDPSDVAFTQLADQHDDTRD